MGACVLIVCPRCKGEFVVNPKMLGREYIDFHCPFCDNYFKEKEADEIKK